MKYNLNISKGINEYVINEVFSAVFRSNYDELGFVVLSFEEEIDSRFLRKCMVELKIGLSKKCEETYKEQLDYYWLGRFNQQNTTKFHRDNASKDSYLMLGYEPTQIESKLYFADYHKLIFDKKIAIDKYYELYNPIFKDGEELLKAYIHEVENFDNKKAKIVLMNNSDLNSNKTFGLLHKAKIINKDLKKNRIINSMMLYLNPTNEPNNKTEKDENWFLNTEEISN